MSHTPDFFTVYSLAYMVGAWSKHERFTLFSGLECDLQTRNFELLHVTQNFDSPTQISTY